MKYYYYVKNEQRLGPFTLEEIQAQKIKKSTLIWADGMENWEVAETIEELKDFLVSEPPPIPKKQQPESKKKTKDNTKYDLTYKRETKAIIVGWLLWIVPPVVLTIIMMSMENFQFGPDAKGVIIFNSIVLRIIITVWVTRIAFRQNRDTFAWGLLAFILPLPALIIIGYLKKLRFKIDMIFENDIRSLLKKANKYYSYLMYYECIEVLNKAIGLEHTNLSLFELRGTAYYFMGDLENSKKDFYTVLHTDDKFSSIADNFLGNIAFKEHDKETAIKYWIKAKEKKSEAAITKLKRFHDYTHKYFLTKKELKEKVGEVEYQIENIQATYLGNLYQTEFQTNLKNKEVVMKEHTYGLSFEFKDFKTTYIAIAFYEIKNSTYNADKKQFEIYLSDNNSLIFNCEKLIPFDLGWVEEMRDKIEKEKESSIINKSTEGSGLRGCLGIIVKIILGIFLLFYILMMIWGVFGLD